MKSSVNDHWGRQARRWSHLGHPLSPGPEDAAITSAAISDWLETNPPYPDVLVLGATPQLCRLPLHTGGSVLAVDRSADIIRAIWTPRADAKSGAARADWRQLPVADDSIDLALGDAAFNNIPYPLGYVATCDEVRRVLRRHGQGIFRCFAQPETRETPEQVFSALAQRHIGNFHILKLRLLMAAQPDAETGVMLGDVWDLLHAVWPDLDELAARFAWPTAEVRTIENYRNGTTRYSFPTVDQFRDFFAAAGFRVSKVVVPSYELGERCPTFVLDLTTHKPVQR